MAILPTPKIYHRIIFAKVRGHEALIDQFKELKVRSRVVKQMANIYVENHMTELETLTSVLKLLAARQHSHETVRERFNDTSICVWIRSTQLRSTTLRQELYPAGSVKLYQGSCARMRKQELRGKARQRQLLARNRLWAKTDVQGERKSWRIYDQA